MGNALEEYRKLRKIVDNALFDPRPYKDRYDPGSWPLQNYKLYAILDQAGVCKEVDNA